MRQKKMHFSRSTRVPLTIMIPYLMTTSKANKPLCKVHTRHHHEHFDFLSLFLSLFVMSLRWNLTSRYFFLSYIIQVCEMIKKNERFHQWRRCRIFLTFLLTTYCYLHWWAGHIKWWDREICHGNRIREEFLSSPSLRFSSWISRELLVLFVRWLTTASASQRLTCV